MRFLESAAGTGLCFALLVAVMGVAVFALKRMGPRP